MKKILAIMGFFILALMSVKVTLTNKKNDQVQTYVFPAVGVGTIIAAVISYVTNQSILWAILHGFLAWIYIIYYVITR
jgi:hypothetical protein